MTKLNQVIAIEKGTKSRVYSTISELHKAVQKPELFNGFSKQYQKQNEEYEDLPPEKKRVQFTADAVIEQLANLSTDLFDVTAIKDWANCAAKGDIAIDGKTILTGVPVSYLLFLEKQLTDIRTFVDCIPVLDESESWTLDANSNLYKTEETKTHRTKKVQKALVMYHATPEHPAQTQLITEDILVGFWGTVKLSGAMPKPEKEAVAAKVEKLLKAVKEARESANGVDIVETPNVSGSIFSYLFSK